MNKLPIEKSKGLWKKGKKYPKENYEKHFNIESMKDDIMEHHDAKSHLHSDSSVEDAIEDLSKEDTIRIWFDMYGHNEDKVNDLIQEAKKDALS